jgi:hypothetical protein
MARTNPIVLDISLIHVLEVTLTTMVCSSPAIMVGTLPLWVLNTIAFSSDTIMRGTSLIVYDTNTMRSNIAMWYACNTLVIDSNIMRLKPPLWVLYPPLWGRNVVCTYQYALVPTNMWCVSSIMDIVLIIMGFV